MPAADLAGRPDLMPAADLAGRPDLIERNFTADAPAQKLVGDITHMLLTREGFVYPAGCDGAATRKELLATPWRNTCEPNWSKTLCKIGGSELPAHQGCDDFSFGSGIAVHVR